MWQKVKSSLQNCSKGFISLNDISCLNYYFVYSLSSCSSLNLRTFCNLLFLFYRVYSLLDYIVLQALHNADLV